MRSVHTCFVSNECCFINTCESALCGNDGLSVWVSECAYESMCMCVRVWGESREGKRGGRTGGTEGHAENPSSKRRVIISLMPGVCHTFIIYHWDFTCILHVVKNVCVCVQGTLCVMTFDTHWNWYAYFGGQYLRTYSLHAWCMFFYFKKGNVGKMMCVYMCVRKCVLACMRVGLCVYMYECMKERARGERERERKKEPGY